MSDDTPLFKDSDRIERESGNDQPVDDTPEVPLTLPLRGDTGQNQPVPLPVVTDNDDLDALIDPDAEPRSGSTTDESDHSRD